MDFMERLDKNRNIPPHNREATKPADAYRYLHPLFSKLKGCACLLAASH